MITVRIDEQDLLEMLMDRVNFWINDEDVTELFENYYEDMIQSGVFDNCKLDIMAIVDNDYVNNTVIINKEDFEQYNIESEIDDKIIAFDKEKDLYLVRTY